jgi:ribosome-associated toxin RatA of RatAB toxin-antitoxin module
MAEATSSSIVTDAEPAAIMDVIADLASYPEWAASVKSVEVLTVFDDEDERPAQARFVLDAGAVKDTYVLDYEWDGDNEVRWSLVEALILTAMDGVYRLTPQGQGQTQVDYDLTLDLKIPMIGMLRRKAEKVITDTALRELKRRVEE